jgi:hypothetical protein
MESRAAIYMSFKKTQCTRSLSFIVINVIIINFDEINCHSYAQLFYISVITVTDRKK